MAKLNLTQVYNTLTFVGVFDAENGDASLHIEKHGSINEIVIKLGQGVVECNSVQRAIEVFESHCARRDS